MTNKISLPKKEKKQYFYTGQHRCLVHISKFNLLPKTVQERKRKGGIEIKYACSRNNVVLGVKYRCFDLDHNVIIEKKCVMLRDRQQKL